MAFVEIGEIESDSREETTCREYNEMSQAEDKI